MPTRTLIPPHGGGQLINRIADPERAEVLRERAERLPKITLSHKQFCDFEMIAIGAFSPLIGFAKQKDFDSICETMHLVDPIKPPEGRRRKFQKPRYPVWPIPITLAVDDETEANLERRGQAALYHQDGTLLGVMDTADIYEHDKEKMCKSVFGTEDPEHPGVKAVQEEGNWLVGGAIHVITVTPEREPGEQFTEHRLAPAETREEFEKRGWTTIAAFQTRNPIHRAHEYLTKCALEMCDGLLIHPLVGETKPGDIPADVRMKCYEVLIDNYYVKERTMLSVMPAAMRYAGPREAVLHALVRQNYGVSHFIVGRDHAGVGDYYGTYDAQNIFDEFHRGEIFITPLKFEHSFFCRKTGQMGSAKTTPSDPSDRVFLSGTKVREMLTNGERPPEEFSRPEVADVLIEWATSQVQTANA